MDKREFDRTRALNKTLIKKGVPPEIRIKILIESVGLNGLAKICGDEPELMDICGIYKNTICKASLEAWKINYDPEAISACELVKRIIYIITSQINSSADMITDPEENYNLTWHFFTDTEKLEERNVMFFKWAVKWGDPVVLQVMLTHNDVDLQLPNTRKELVEIACRSGDVEMLRTLMSLGITEPEAFRDGLDSAVIGARLDVIDYLLSIGIGDPETLLERAVRSDVPSVFLHLVFKRGVDVQSYTNVESPRILKQLVELVKGAYFQN
jgi:hypothetical protein